MSASRIPGEMQDRGVGVLNTGRQNCVGRHEPHNLKPLRLKSIPFCAPYVSNAWTPRQRQLQSGHTSKRTEQKDYDFTIDGQGDCEVVVPYI